MAVAEVKVVPIGTPSPSISSYITTCYQVVEESGLKHQLTPTSTIIEGELEKILDVVKKMHRVPFEDGANRVLTSISIDERRDKESNMESMVESVLEGSYAPTNALQL